MHMVMFESVLDTYKLFMFIEVNLLTDLVCLVEKFRTTIMSMKLLFRAYEKAYCIT